MEVIISSTGTEFKILVNVDVYIFHCCQMKSESINIQCHIEVRNAQISFIADHPYDQNSIKVPLM